MKRILFLLFVLGFWHPSVSLSQNADVARRTAALWDFFEKKMRHLPLDAPVCPAAALNELGSKNNVDVAFWLTEVDKMRVAGQIHCCQDMLAFLEPKVSANPHHRVQWLTAKARVANAFEKWDEATALTHELTAYAEAHQVDLGLAKLCEARLASNKRQFTEALKYGEEALSIARKEGNKRLEINALSVISATSRDIYMVTPEKYAPFELQALAIAEQLRDTSLMRGLHVDLSLDYMDDNTPENQLKSLEHLERAFALTPSQLPIHERLDLMRQFAIFLQTTGDADKAFKAYEYAANIAKILGKHSLTQNIYEQMADIGEGQKNYDLALEMMDSAKVYCDFTRELGYFYFGYARLYEAKGETQKAIEHYRKAFDEQVKSYTNRNSALLTEMETRLRTQEKELELNKQRQQRWFLVGIALLSLLLLGVALWSNWRNRRQLSMLKAQKTLIEKQDAELRRLDEAKTRFFTNVSHELRTPLTLILGPLSNVLSAPELSNRQFTLLSLVRQQARGLLRLVNEILDLSKLEAGKMQLSAEPVAFFPFIRRLVAAFESHAERHNIRFTFDYRPDRYLQIELDVHKFEKILNNFLSNALKFTPSGGTVAVAVVEKPNTLKVSVSDTGRGIHPDDLPHVFNRFYQSTQPDAASEGGTGIGLALANELAKLMNGTLRVESTLGKGSLFAFEFPKKEVLGTGNVPLSNEDLNFETETTPSVLSHFSAPMATEKGDLPTILVVEDNHSLRDYLQLILQDVYRVKTAENGRVALDLLRNTAENAAPSQPNLIISDIMMPEMDGFQLLDALKADAHLAQIPVIMLTARADTQDKIKALRIGVDDYLLKPFEEAELFARIANLLNNQHLRQQFKSQPQPQLPDTEGSLLTPIEDDGEPAEIQKWLSELENAVETRLGDFDLTADAIAGDLAMSRAQFFRRLKGATGLTPNQYLLEMRFSRARQILEQRKESSVKAVAYAVGMRDVKYFSQQFKARFGKLPSEYLN